MKQNIIFCNNTSCRYCTDSGHCFNTGDLKMGTVTIGATKYAVCESANKKEMYK